MRFQRGGFVVGLIVGLLVGLALALGVALYVTKVPVPFMNKVPQRTAEQDAAEAEKNKNWDPNSPLYGKNQARAASGAASGSTSGVLPPVVSGSPAPPATGSARDPAAILADKAPAPPAVKGQALPAGADPFLYFVQAGAYTRNEDAEQQRAKLAILGYEGKVTEREQSGRTMYRVRVGPYDRKDDADTAKDKLSGAGLEAVLVRVQK